MVARAFRSRMSVVQTKIIGSFFLAFGVLVVLGGLAAGETPVVVLPWGVFAVLGIWALVRGSRMGVEVDDSGVAVINFWRIQRYSWDEIDRFETDWTNGPRPHVVMRDGTKTRIWGIGGWVGTKRENWPDQKMIDELNELLSKG